MQLLIESAMQFIIPCQEGLNDIKLHGSGFEWLSGKSSLEEIQIAHEMLASVKEELPEEPLTDIDTLFKRLFKELLPHSMNTIAGGYLAFIPAGGLFHGALADFIALSMNRYIPYFMAAPGLAAIELQAIRWLCDLIGLPLEASGIFTSGGSMATLAAIHAARIAKLSETSENSFQNGIAYVSNQGHYCIEKGFTICGFPHKNVRKIPVDENFRIRIDLLKQAMTKDASEGLKPFLVVGTAGTTGSGAVDNLEKLAELSRQFNTWFHVDAAYGGFFNLTEIGSDMMHGIKLADSVILDPHKSMFLPYGTGALLVRDHSTMRKAFDFTGSYMPESVFDPFERPQDIMCASPELSREFRGLRVWLPIKMLGIKVFRSELELKLKQARWMSEQLTKMKHVKIVAKPQLSIFAFKLEPEGLSPRFTPKQIDDINREFLKAINRRGNILLSPFQGRNHEIGGFSLRIAIVSFRTEWEHLRVGLVDIQKSVDEILAKL